MLHGTTDAELMRERLFQSEKMASVGRLVSGVAHELNNPLTGIMGFAQLLLLRDLDPAARHEAETIRAEAERASKIVQNLLSFARRRSPERVPVDLNALIERVLSLWEYDLRVRDIVVRRDLGAGAPLIEADAHQIQQLLLNVLTNAAQALRAAGGGGAITVSTHAAGGYVRTHISDNGPGIAPDHLRRIFDPFFTTKPVGEGTGLGLTICYGIVEEHQGRITVESAPGQGATVVIDLPVAASTSLEQPALEPSTPQGPSRSILVVDDEPAIIDLLDGALTLDGHRVDRSTSAQAALERVCPGAYDAVITDVRMPGMDGIAFYRWLVERDPGLVGRVIFTSGHTVNSQTLAFDEAGRKPYLAKPITLQEL
ncbi:MAG: ATP-binding protein, partial [Dehalococcoidia bacterium]